MIHYIVADADEEIVRERLEPRAAAQDLPIRVVPYSRLTGAIHFASAVFIFAGLESIPTATREHAARLWRSVAAVRIPTLLLNHPLLAMQRYELLRELRERGINDFDVYRMIEWRRPRRFPVFFRDETRKLQHGTQLFGTEAELDAALDAIARADQSRDSKLIVEYRSAREPDGSFRRYGAHSINGLIVPCRPAFHDQWIVPATKVAGNADGLAVEREHLAANPHAESLRRVFRMARIDFGRIDYAVIDGRIQVYGIHTDPVRASASGGGDAGGEQPNPDLDRLVAAMSRLLTVLGVLQEQAARLTAQ